jgi:predicted phosphohydrolase
MSDFIKVMRKYDIKRCYYGHLHSSSIKDAVEGKYYGVNFKLVSADGLNFKLLEI